MRIELPNDAESAALVKRCIEAVALRFSDNTVSVDLTVSNAGRIWKLYGTLACKGDSSPERPHRLARMLEAPDAVTPAARKLLEKLAALAPEEPNTHVRQTSNGHGAFALERWIADHNLDVSGPHSWGSGRKWLFSICPWNPDHTNKAAYLVQHANGAIAAGCHHNGYSGKGWHELRDKVEPGWREKRTARANGQDEERPNPWALAKDVPSFLAEEEKEFQGLAKDLLAPGALTLIDSPKGIGKTQVIHALAVTLATGGVFRGERVKAVKVLLLDRENPVSTLKKRLRAWGATTAENLHVLTRQNAPDLKARKAWEAFPAEQYDVLIVDSVGASTEGITEKEGKQNSEVLATLLDLTHRDISIVLLQNTEKTGTNIRGRGEWADRADIQYEVRDATDFTPSGKRPWWLELPADGAANWAERAARRKGRTDYRLAFIPAKFRLAAEPDPFCLEISLPENEPWTLRDVTDEILQAGEETVAKAEHAKNEKLEKAAAALAEVVKDRAATGEPILKKEAEEFLCKEENLSQKTARNVINSNVGKLWKIEPLQGQKGHPQALLPLSQTDEQPKSGTSENPRQLRASEAGISVAPEKSTDRNGMSLKISSNMDYENALFRSPVKSRATEVDRQKPASNGGCRDPMISVDDEIEKHTDSRDAGGFNWGTGQQTSPKDSKVF